MSDSQDQADKTEDPTPKKLADARKKGQVVKSKEVNNWIMLATGTLLILTMGPGMANQTRVLLEPFIAQPHAIPTDFEHLRFAWVLLFRNLAWTLAIGALVLMVAAAATGLVQHGLVFSGESLKPDLSKLSPIKGFQRLFSLKSLVEFVKGIIKLAIVALVAALVVVPDLAPLPLFVGQEAGQILDHLHLLALKLLAAVVGAMLFIAALDFLYQKFEFLRKQRMSRREIKEEHKQLEGDPMVKARLRAIRAERARKRMMAAVPEADVVVTNPTHYAVALKYDQAEMEAPTVVAKGSDWIALKIREIADENKVPIVENPPLARTLYETTEIDQLIPVAQYQAVAQIISYVWRLKGKMPQPAARRSRIPVR